MLPSPSSTTATVNAQLVVHSGTDENLSQCTLTTFAPGQHEVGDFKTEPNYFSPLDLSLKWATYSSEETAVAKSGHVTGTITTRSIASKNRKPLTPWKYRKVDINGLERFVCPMCPSDFKHRKSLSSHIRIHHPDIRPDLIPGNIDDVIRLRTLQKYSSKFPHASLIVSVAVERENNSTKSDKPSKLCRTSSSACKRSLDESNELDEPPPPILKNESLLYEETIDVVGGGQDDCDYLTLTQPPPTIGMGSFRTEPLLSNNVTFSSPLKDINGLLNVSRQKLSRFLPEKQILMESDTATQRQRQSPEWSHDRLSKQYPSLPTTQTDVKMTHRYNYAFLQKHLKSLAEIIARITRRTGSDYRYFLFDSHNTRLSNQTSLLRTFRTVNKLLRNRQALLKINHACTALPNCDAPQVDMELMKCTSCSLSYPDLTGLKQHLRQHLPTNTYMCLFCPNVVSSSFLEIDRHLMMDCPRMTQNLLTHLPETARKRFIAVNRLPEENFLSQFFSYEDLLPSN